ncbi:MAG: helix-turn-helix transcriptional regulator [Actinomycetota bacterium]
MPIRTDQSAFGAELRRWRRHRRLSQLELASTAEVSQRHLSFLENGRSRPSPEMVEHLAIVLDVPLRARNALLNAAGFAAAYTEEPLDGPALSQIREGLETLVEAHDPYPAYVVDRCWNLLIANTAAARLTELLLPTDVALEHAGNLLRLVLHPDGARSRIVNWEQAAIALVERLAAECGADPTDAELAALFDEVTSYPGIADLPRPSLRTAAGNLVTDLRVATDDGELRLITTISSLAAASDVTLDELRLETLLPIDRASADLLRRFSERG